MSDQRAFDVSTWLAHRALDAERLGEPAVPEFVVLPGAKVAIAHDRLCAHQEAGRSEGEITARINARWDQENTDRLAAHGVWVDGPYQHALLAEQEKKARDAARELRRQAALEALTAERD